MINYKRLFILTLKIENMPLRNGYTFSYVENSYYDLLAGNTA